LDTLRGVTDPTIERTLVLVKPDGVERGLVGEVIRRIEAKGYRLVALDVRVPTAELLAEHYAEHVRKPFYAPLVEFMRSGPVVALVAEGQRVVEGFRSLAGATQPTAALRRPRPRLGLTGRAEHRARLGLGRIGRQGDKALVSTPGLTLWCFSPADEKLPAPH
jgi:nucleoside-diphosphate kinase